MPAVKRRIGKTDRARVSPELLAVAIMGLLPVDVAYVEEVAQRPGMGNLMTLGQAQGMVLGVLAMAGVRIVRVMPSEWKRKMGVSSRGADTRAVAASLSPGLAERLTRKKDVDRADAILLAHYGLGQERDRAF